jgi:hypothetical protein
MDTDPAVIAAAIVAGGTAVGTAIRFVGKRALRSYDERTAASKAVADALIEQQQQLAVFTEASRETNRLLQAVLLEMTSINTKISTVFHLDAPSRPAPSPTSEAPTPIRGVPTAPTTYLHVARKEKP